MNRNRRCIRRWGGSCRHLDSVAVRCRTCNIDGTGLLIICNAVVQSLCGLCAHLAGAVARPHEAVLQHEVSASNSPDLIMSQVEAASQFIISSLRACHSVADVITSVTISKRLMPGWSKNSGLRAWMMTCAHPKAHHSAQCRIDKLGRGLVPN